MLSPRHSFCMCTSNVCIPLHATVSQIRKDNQTVRRRVLTRIERLFSPRYSGTRPNCSGWAPTRLICSCSHITYCSMHSK